jgi:hypothetical protein
LWPSGLSREEMLYAASEAVVVASTSEDESGREFWPCDDRRSAIDFLVSDRMLAWNVERLTGKEMEPQRPWSPRRRPRSDSLESILMVPENSVKKSPLVATCRAGMS